MMTFSGSREFITARCRCNALDDRLTIREHPLAPGFLRLMGLERTSLTCPPSRLILKKGGARYPSTRTLQTKGTCFPNEPKSKDELEGKQFAVVVGATSKWQSNGRNTLLAHGRILDDSGLPVGARWGVGGAIAQKFA